MKISQFRSLLLWFAVAACGWDALISQAGDLARARARLTGLSSTDADGVNTQVVAEEPIAETASRLLPSSTAATASSPATKYTPAQAGPSLPVSGVPTLAPPRPQTTTTGAQPLVISPAAAPTTTEKPTVAAPSAALATERVVEPRNTAPGTTTTDASSRRVYHNALRPEGLTSTSQAPTELKSPLRGSPSPSSSTEPTLSAAAGSAGVVASQTADKPSSEKPEPKPAPVATPIVAPQATTAAKAEAEAASPTTTKSTTSTSPLPATVVNPTTTKPAVVGRATDAVPVRTADPSQPGRLPPLSNDREPGEPDHEQRMTIGRTPADDKTKAMFESKEQKPLTPELELLKRRVQTALAVYYKNWTLNTQQHSPWEVMHAIVAYGVDTKLLTNGGRETTTAIGHLCYSGVCRNQPILTIRNGELYALRGPGVQGHPGQFLAILAQSYLQRDYPLYVGGEKFTLQDLIKAEMKDCEAGTELTFKLISLMHYLPSDATWTNFQGQRWSLDRLVREEIVQPVRGAACGGTHRLMGLSYAVRKREQRGEPIDGIYLEAKKYIDQYHKYTFSLQNPDGSFSTAWFVRREARNDIDRRMQTTGHVLEWLAFSLSDEQLRDPRVVKAVKYISDILLNEHYTQWEVGHLGHGLHALQIYNERVFGGEVRSFDGLLSRKPAAAAAPAAR
ncbi:MAG: hypothetical protein J0M17_00605 [Planctomycetes bacterium]|nr:hypothetical protein [Planctomycetota bacterium]